jgi:hypothetical protein
MRAIFLDVDGVLNNDNTTTYTEANYFVFVDDYLVERVKNIIDETDAIVVLSSDWRDGFENEFIKPELDELIHKLKEYEIELYGYTPILTFDNMTDDEMDKYECFNCIPRGVEIQKYLDEHPEIEEFVILDDRRDMKPNMAHLVNTNYHFGLTEQDVEKAIDVLNGKLIKSRKGLW